MGKREGERVTGGRFGGGRRRGVNGKVCGERKGKARVRVSGFLVLAMLLHGNTSLWVNGFRAFR